MTRPTYSQLTVTLAEMVMLVQDIAGSAVVSPKHVRVQLQRRADRAARIATAAMRDQSGISMLSGSMMKH